MNATLTGAVNCPLNVSMMTTIEETRIMIPTSISAKVTKHVLSLFACFNRSSSISANFSLTKFASSLLYFLSTAFALSLLSKRSDHTHNRYGYSLPSSRNFLEQSRRYFLFLAAETETPKWFAAKMGPPSSQILVNCSSGISSSPANSSA